MLILAPVSAGELLDKITILRVKQTRITDPAKLGNVRYELAQLEAIAARHIAASPELDALVERLHGINAELWDIEDGKRDAERRHDFGAHFIALARAVYLKNDLRARIKKDINLLLGSKIVEEKSYAGV
jgi:hypothetical protein